MVSWFAGLFYLPRLLIYHREAQDKSDIERKILSSQFQIMERKLIRIIMIPASVLTLLFGLILIHIRGGMDDWLWIKLVFVALLFAYQFFIIRTSGKFKQGKFSYSSSNLRLINEVASILLFAIVSLAIIKRISASIYMTVGIVTFFTFTFIIIRTIKKR